MTREQATEAIRTAKEEHGLTWAGLAEAVGRSPVWSTAALLGQGTMSAGEAANVTEEFGDGIMSAVDFEIRIERRADPKGDRVVVTPEGKFLPYRVW